MSEIIPRWEWRSFGRRFPSAEERLARVTPSGVQESDEIYLLSASGDNVKVRDALMDVKVLQEVNADGLEQWTPVMKAGFPLSASDTAKVLGALHRSVPGGLRDSYTLEEFLEAFAGPDSGIRVVRVHKRRVRYAIDGCMAELSDILANDRSARTIAVESEDAAAVVRAVAGLGLGGYTNISYPRALAELIDDAPESYAVIDVGTNSVKFHIGARDAAGDVAHRCRSRRGDPPRRGAGRDRRDRRCSARADGRGDLRDGGRSKAHGRAGDRCGGHRGAEDRREQRRSGRRRPRAHRPADRGHFGRG